MGVISSALNSALEGLGRATMDVGENGLGAGYKVWKWGAELAMDYLKMNPRGLGSAWGVATGSLFHVSMGIASSLSVLFFVIGWLHETIDVRNNFTLENMFRFFIRYVITAGLIINCLTLTQGVIDCSLALVSSVDVSSGTFGEGDNEDLFSDLIEGMEDEEASGTQYLGTGIVVMISGLFGGIVIMVCSIQLLLSVLGRLFKLYVIIPFGPVALSSFAGGGSLSQSGTAWIKTLVSYCLEAVVIAIAIKISFALFQDGSLGLGSGGASNLQGAILLIVSSVLPMITACACVKGAEGIIRRCLALG